jgi:hypothetical protein
MECPNCGWIEVEALTFCPQCGSQLLETPARTGGGSQTRWMHEPSAGPGTSSVQEETRSVESVDTAAPAELLPEEPQEEDVIEVVVVEESEEGIEESTELDLPIPEGGDRDADRGETNIQATPSQEVARAELIFEGEGGPARFSFQGEVLIGRTTPESGPVDIDLSGLPNARYVSRKHARIFFQDGMYWVEDLGSTNGVFVNQGSRILKPTPLKPGDRVAFATLTFIFRVVEE